MAFASQLQTRNQLLKGLSNADLALIQPHLEPMALPVGLRLNEPNKPTPFVYFLDEGLSSILIGPERTTGVEIGIAGREGLVGTSVVLGAGQSPHDTFIQVAGSGWRIASEHLNAAMTSSRSLHALLLRYVHAFLVQMSSTAYANADYRVEEHLARWILGVRRPGVTVATHALEGSR